VSQPEDEYEGGYDPGPNGDYDPNDPFAAPPKNINFTEEWTAGETYELDVIDAPRTIQGFDIKTKKPAIWDDGRPKMVAVTTVEWGGEVRSLWAPIPSALFKRLREATTASRTSIRRGSHLSIPYEGLDRKAKKPGQNAPHAFGEITHAPPQ
jgi:hypothetical protein